jgi:hypothetical protein
VSSDQQQLRQILRSAEHPEIKLLGKDGKKIDKVSAADALRLALAKEYEWCGSTRRVRAIRLLDKPPAWQPCYRNTSSPCLPPSIEWCLSRRG